MIYFVQIGHDGPIKIGDSDCVYARFQSLKTCVPWKLNLLRVIGAPYSRAIYYHFRASHIAAEWYEPTPELLAFIATPCALPCPPNYWKRKRRTANPSADVHRFIESVTAQASAA